MSFNFWYNFWYNFCWSALLIGTTMAFSSRGPGFKSQRGRKNFLFCFQGLISCLQITYQLNSIQTWPILNRTIKNPLIFTFKNISVLAMTGLVSSLTFQYLLWNVCRMTSKKVEEGLSLNFLLLNKIILLTFFMFNKLR